MRRSWQENRAEIQTLLQFQPLCSALQNISRQLICRSAQTKKDGDRKGETVSRGGAENAERKNSKQNQDGEIKP